MLAIGPTAADPAESEVEVSSPAQGGELYQC